MQLLTSFIKNPSRTGAIAPSSAHLAKSMAELACGASQIIELGAGTGPVTRELLTKFGAERLTSIELCPDLVLQLKNRYPRLQVTCAPAEDYLKQCNFQQSAIAIVSSLPFRSLPPSIKLNVINELIAFMARHPNSWLIQFTYGLTPPFPGNDFFLWKRECWVAKNIPPAFVWTGRLRNEPCLRH